MPEVREVPRSPETGASPELRQAIAAAKAEVTAEAANPQTQAAKETARLGLFKELWQDAVKPYYKDQLAIQWKNLKAAGMATLALIPLVGEGASAARAAGKAERMGGKIVSMEGKLGKQMTKLQELRTAGKTKQAVRIEQKLGKTLKKLTSLDKQILDMMNSTQATRYLELIGRGIDPNQAGKAAMLGEKSWNIFFKEFNAGNKTKNALNHALAGVDTTETVTKTVLGKEFKIPVGKLKYGAKEGGKFTLGKALHSLDPYPDVPEPVQYVGLLEMVGAHGAELVPVAWQLASNKIQEVQAVDKANRAVTRIIFTRIKDKLEAQKGQKAAMWAKRVEEARHG